MVVLKGFLNKKMTERTFKFGTKESGRINEVVVRRGSTVFHSLNPSFARSKLTPRYGVSYFVPVLHKAFSMHIRDC